MVEHIKKENKFVYVINNEVAGLVEYTQFDENSVEIFHTYVLDKFRGQQIAFKLMEYAYDYFKHKNITIVASCSYAKSWLEKNTI